MFDLLGGLAMWLVLAALVSVGWDYYTYDDREKKWKEEYYR